MVTVFIVTFFQTKDIIFKICGINSKSCQQNLVKSIGKPGNLDHFFLIGGGDIKNDLVIDFEGIYDPIHFI